MILDNMIKKKIIITTNTIVFCIVYEKQNGNNFVKGIIYIYINVCINIIIAEKVLHLPADTSMSISIVPLLSIAWLSSFRSGDVADSRIGLLPVGAGNRSGLVLGLTGRLTTIARGDRSFFIRF